MAYEIEYNFSLDETIRCRAKINTDREGGEGEYFGYFYVKDTKWAIVVWDGDDDPDLYKANCLEIQSRKWESID